MKRLKQLLIAVLIVQLAIPHTYAQTPTDPNRDSEAASEIENLAAETYKNPSDKKVFENVNRVADGLEKGHLPPDVLEIGTDIFHLAHQRVQIMERGVVVKEFSVNEVRARYEAIAASDLRPIYNLETRELVIEGVNGIKADGTGGNVVARHIIPNIDMVSMFASNELLVFINSKGEVGMMDMGFVAKQVFKNPLFVVDNAWKPKETLNLSQAKIKFMTPGTDPLTRDAYSGYIYTRDEKGEPAWLNGDIRITVPDQNGNEVVLALLPRSHFYMRGQLAAAMILSKLALLDPGSNAQEFMQKVAAEAEKANLPLEDIPGGYDDALKRFLQNIEPDQIDDLKSSTKSLGAYSQRRYGRQNLTEALEQFQEIKRNFAQKNDPMDNINEMERRWYENVTPVQVESPFRTSFTDVLSKVIQKTTSLNSILIMGGVLSAAYIGFPFAYENIEALQQIKLMNWFYLNALPDVLNQPYTYIPREVDGEVVMEYVNYRKYMILNMVALVALWPAAHVSAFAFKKALNMTYGVVKDSNTRFATFIREMYKNWSPLSNWQVVTSFGMRVYSWFIYPVIRFSVEQLARQKSAFVAIGNYQNPLKIIGKDSEIGKKLGLESSMTLGLNNPLLSTKRLQEDTDLKLKAQALIKEQNMRKSQMAFLLATLIVSEQSGIDPATLLQLGSGDLQLQDLANVFNDERKKREWFLTAKQVYEMLQQDGSDVKAAVSEMNPEEFNDYYEKAKSIADKVHSRSDLRLHTSTLWTRFKRAPYWLLNNMPFVSGGLNDYKFLNTIYTNKFVSDQVHKQFYIDHLMVVGIVALMPGENGRANYDKPHNLAADPRGILWSTGPHLNDTVMNTYIHFFVSGAKTAMVYQSVKAKSDSLPSRKESGLGYEDPDRLNLVYDPYEDFKYLTTDREQGFLGSTWDWTKSLLNFPESQLGEYMLKSLKRRLTTLQGGFLTFMIFQMAFIDNRLVSDALMAFVLMFSAAYWRYAWPWDPVQRGNSMIEDRFNAKLEALKSVKESMHEALRIQDPAESEPRIRAAYQGLLGLFIKENPGVLSRLKAVSKVFDPSEKQRIQKELKSAQNSESMYYYGLLAKLSLAMRKKDKASEALYRDAIIKLMGGENSDEIRRLSSKGLFDLALSHSPVYTKPSSVLSAFTTLGAAIGTTVLAISLMTETTDVVDKPTWDYVLTWAVANFVFFGGAYLLTGAKPWKFYLEKWEALKNKFRRDGQALAAEPAGACASFFR